MYKEDLALNNLQWLICLKTKSNQTFVKCRDGDYPSVDWAAQKITVYESLYAMDTVRKVKS